MAVQIGWRIRAAKDQAKSAKEQTKSARDTIDGLDGKDAEPILAQLDKAVALQEKALGCLREAEKAAQALTQKLIAAGRLPDERGSQPDRRAPNGAA